jgi:uncharacterized protein
MQKRNTIVFAVVVVTAALIFGATRTQAAAQFTGTQSSTPGRVLRVSGTAIVYGKPDYARIELGVAKLSPRVMDAKTACDQAMQHIQSAVRKAGIQQDDIQTVSYQIFPVQPEGKPNAARQWKVAHHISIKVRKVAAVASVLDAAVANGATDVSQVDYAIEKIMDLRSKARAEAVRVARQKATELASLTGVQLGEPMTISDSSYGGGYLAQSVTNSSFDYGLSPGRSGNVLSGGQIAVDAREDVEFAIH